METPRTLRIGSLAIATVALTLVPRAAFAQVASPTGTMKAEKASEGKTEVAKEGFAAVAKPTDKDAKDATDLSLSFGGLFLSGNSKNVAFTGAGNFRLRRQEHQIGVGLAGNFARSGKQGTPVDTTAENIQGLIRYDFFFVDRMAVFLQTSARKDRFQGLDIRLNIGPGFAYYFVDDKKQRLWAEVGYDFQFDSRTAKAIADAQDPSLPPAKQQFLADTKTRHNARVFVGYENKLYKQVSFITGLEYLQAIAQSDEATPPGGAAATTAPSLKAIDAYRLNYDIGLKSSVAEHLAISTTFSLRYDHAPLPTVESTDTVTAINLVYTF